MKTTLDLPINNRVFLLLLLFVLIDFAYSGYQHYHTRLDGDIASIVVPKTEYRHILQDPFGVAAITTEKRYAGANRFFAHYSMRAYFRQVPFFFMQFVGKVDALYWSSAAFKTFVQLSLVIIIALYAHSLFQLQTSSLLALMAIIAPFFQTNGYAHVLGIVNPSVTYVFFYSWPMALLLLFYYPFFRSWICQKPPQINVLGKVGLAILVVYLPFSSPICSAIILLISSFYALDLCLHWWKDRFTKENAINTWLVEHVHPTTFVFFVAISIVSLYALYLGQFNSENSISTLPLGKRYVRLLQGLFSMLTLKLGYPVLLGSMLINWFLLRLLPDQKAEIIRRCIGWFLLFSVLYLLLLPLGGYRSYRPYIVRTDTMLPVICGLVILYSTVAIYLLGNLSAIRQKYYVVLLLVVAIIFTAADGSSFDDNSQERIGLDTLMQSQEEVVALPRGQQVLSWDNLEKQEESLWNAKLLYYWGLTDTVRLYYNRLE